MSISLIAILTFLLAAAVVGWIVNIVQLVHTIDDPVTGMFILKCIGVVAAPLGAVLGYVGMF